MYANDVSDILEALRNDRKPFRNPRHLLGYRRGKKVWVTESTLRRATVEQLLEVGDIEPAPRRRRGVLPKKQPWCPDSLIGELLWCVWGFFSVVFGNRNPYDF